MLSEALKMKYPPLCGGIFIFLTENHAIVAWLDRALAMSRKKNGLNKEKRATCASPPSDEGGGFLRSKKTEGERRGAEWGVSLSLPQSSLTLGQLARREAAPFCLLRRHFPRLTGESPSSEGAEQGATSITRLRVAVRLMR